MAAEETKKPLELADVPIGSIWRHNNGIEYEVVLHTNVGSKQAAHLETIVHKNLVNGKSFSRELSDWARSMTLVKLEKTSAPPEPNASDSDFSTDFHKDKFVIWSDEHNLYWRSNAQGYTDREEEAGIYTKVEAQKYVRGVSHDKKLSARPARVKRSELAAKLDDIQSKLKLAGISDILQFAVKAKSVESKHAALIANLSAHGINPDDIQTYYIKISRMENMIDSLNADKRSNREFIAEAASLVSDMRNAIVSALSKDDLDGLWIDADERIDSNDMLDYLKKFPKAVQLIAEKLKEKAENENDGELLDDVNGELSRLKEDILSKIEKNDLGNFSFYDGPYVTKENVLTFVNDLRKNIPDFIDTLNDKISRENEPDESGDSIQPSPFRP